ncbi:hypothetical protein CONLIGDRAFT_683455 [Coniochaeta ligniaria NRRL 30616]|uniref:Casein kinase substrate phosphoprotein PP28 domain-containing protein n=1 Tax=Coniochaeta ligniaria NRRL 30616 TaxID=1408157 RepID=A0A1J7IG92_9PEZI|nr:hypothetical protein CONLIGDRAFT_683455 [Coniochaeta ligniaria NRRL 30616]
MAGGGAPGGNSRGRGGKFKKYTRGGGKHFSRDLRPLDADGNEISMWASGQKKKDESSEEESSEEESSEEESDDAGPGASAAALSREERKKEKAAKKAAAVARAKAASVQVGDLPPSGSEEESSDDEADMPANPNHSKAARSQTKVVQQTSAAVDEATDKVKKLAVSGTMNRKERESAEAAEAKERYRKLHEAGKTDEAKADLARLRLIREKREQEAARKQAEKEEREADAAAKKAEIDAKEAKKREAAMGPTAKGKGKSKK